MCAYDYYEKYLEGVGFIPWRRGGRPQLSFLDAIVEAFAKSVKLIWCTLTEPERRQVKDAVALPDLDKRWH